MLLYKDLGYKMNMGYDLTSNWDPSSSKKKGLFSMFDSVFPKFKLEKDYASRHAKWDVKGHYGAEQIRYAALDAFVSLFTGTEGWKQRNKNNSWKSFSMTEIDDLDLATCTYTVVTKKRIEDVSD